MRSPSLMKSRTEEASASAGHGGVEPPKDKKKTLGARRWVLKVLTPTTPTITAVTSDIRVE